MLVKLCNFSELQRPRFKDRGDDSYLRGCGEDLLHTGSETPIPVLGT